VGKKACGQGGPLKDSFTLKEVPNRDGQQFSKRGVVNIEREGVDELLFVVT